MTNNKVGTYTPTPQSTSQPLYYNQHYSDKLVQMIRSVSDTEGATNSSQQQHFLTNQRSQSDPTWEVLKVNFKAPVSISRITFKLYEISSEYEVYYRDRSDNLLPVLNRSLYPFKGSVSSGHISEWYLIDQRIKPVVATSLEIRLRRVLDNNLGDVTTSLGVKDVLIKREVYDAQDAMAPLERSVDSLGNTVSHSITEWGPEKAIDGDSFTYWKSEPQPDPDAVVSLYLDVSKDGGILNPDTPQRIDRLWIDPIYSGQQINLYYSNDDTVGTRHLPTTRLHPLVNENTSWSQGVGLTLDQSDSEYTLDGTQLMYDKGSPFWMGMVWQARFAPGESLSGDLTLIDGGAAFSMEYSPTLDAFSFTLGSVTAFLPPISFTEGQELIFTMGFTGNSIFINAFSKVGNNLGSTSQPASTSPPWTLISLKNGEGTISQWFIKQDKYNTQEANYFVSAPYDAVLTESNLQNNMLYGADFTSSEIGFGGNDENYFTQKQWTPIWRDWTVERGFLYFPAPVYAKYLKAEFTRLTEEPYPIWESGIDVQYQTFPISVTKSLTDTTVSREKEVTTSTTTRSSTRGVIGQTSNRTIDYTSNYSQSQQTVTVGVGSGVISNVPHLFEKPLDTMMLTERASSTVFSSSSSTQVLQQAQDAIYTVVSGDWLIKIGARFNIPWRDIYNANKQMIDSDPRVKRLPRRSEGWWIFPGQQLRIPNAIMETITSTSTRTERLTTTKTSTTATQRFGTTSLHLYETKTARRDAAVAYFAGVREIIPLKVNYVAQEDTLVYDFKEMSTEEFTISGGLTKTPFGAWLGSGSIEAPTWPSMSAFRRLDLSISGRNLYSRMFSNLSPYGIGSVSNAAWSGPTIWNDTVVPWGPPSAVVSFQFGSNVFFEGKNAVRLVRGDGVGVSGLDSPAFSVEDGVRYRFSAQVYVPKKTDNQFIFQLIDEDDGILHETEIAPPSTGVWENLISTFQVASGFENARVRLVISGDKAQEIYLTELGVNLVSTIPFVSNDGGDNYYEATDAVYREGGFFTFPTSGNELRIKFESITSEDFIFGFVAEPMYLS